VKTDEVNPRIAQGGKAIYGARLGILMLEARFPRIPGDMGYSGTWPFPVFYKVALDSSGHSIIASTLCDAHALISSAALAAE
jgi:hypothetical protein